MHTDPIADLLTRIRNAATARHTTLACPWSRTKEEIVRVLTKAGYLQEYEVEESDPIRKVLKITLHPARAKMTLKRVSTPGHRVYADASHLPNVLRGLGIAVLTTSKGVMTNRDARAAKVGGEVLLEAW